jgi:hypothetical protein
MTDLPRITKLTPTRLLANFVTSTNRTLVGLAAGCFSAKKVIVRSTADCAGAMLKRVSVILCGEKRFAIT